MFCVPFGNEAVVVEGGGPVIAVVENVATTALQFVLELSVKEPVTEACETVKAASLAAREFPTSCSCNAYVGPAVTVPE